MLKLVLTDYPRGEDVPRDVTKPVVVGKPTDYTYTTEVTFEPPLLGERDAEIVWTLNVFIHVFGVTVALPELSRHLNNLDMLVEVVDAIGEFEAQMVITELMCEEDWEYVLRHYHTRVALS